MKNNIFNLDPLVVGSKTPVKDPTMNKVLMLRKILAAGGFIDQVVTGNVPLVLSDAAAKSIVSLTRYGLCAQASTPTPSAPVDIVCNNGAIKAYPVVGSSTQDGTPTPSDPVPIVSLDKGGMVLRSVGNVKDTYNPSTKTITRNVGVYVFDGTEDFTKGTAFYTTNTHFLPSALENIAPFCTHFKGQKPLDTRTGDSLTMTVNGVRSSSSELYPEFQGCVYFYANRNSYATAADFKAWLASQYANGTPVTVLYPLSTPTTELWSGEDLYVDGTPEVLSVSKNILNTTDLQFVPNKYLNNSGEEVSYSGTNYTTMFWPVKPNTTYVVSGTFVESGNYNTGVYFFDENKTLLSRQTSTSAYPRTITTPANCRYVDIQYRQDGNPSTWQMIDVAEQTASVENLFSVGDIADTQDIISGLVTRRIGVYVIDGTENWQRGTAFYTGGEILLDALESSHTCICTHYKGKDTDTLYTGDANQCQVGYDIEGTTFWHRIYITANRSTYPTAAAFKEYLAAQYAAGTPVIVIYPLIEETAESVAGQSLSTAAGTNIVNSVANVSPVGLEIVYKKKK